MRSDPKAVPKTGLFGIDMWHAVEFSRSGRASGAPAVQAVPGATRNATRAAVIRSNPPEGVLDRIEVDVGVVAPRRSGLIDARGAVDVRGFRTRKTDYTPAPGPGQIQDSRFGVIWLTPR